MNSIPRKPDRIFGISGLVHTKNEERHIGQVVANLMPYVDEVVVVDMASTDNTRKIARELGARVEIVQDFGYVEPARAAAVNLCHYQWILNLDADEMIPGALAAELRRIASSGNCDVVRVSRLTYMFGRKLRGSGWSLHSERHPRFYRAGFLRHSPLLHEASTPIEQARVQELPAEEPLAIVHFNYTDWNHFIDKLNRYTSITAREYAAAGRRPSATRAAASAAREVVYRLVLDRGWRDGVVGAGLAFWMAGYHFLIDLKMRQLLRYGDNDQILAQYRSIASDVGPP